VKRRQRDEKRAQTSHFSLISTFSVSPQPDNEIGPNLRRNQTRSVPTHSQKVSQVKRNENNRKFPPKHRQLTPYTTSTMDFQLGLEHLRNLVLEFKASSEERLDRMDMLLGKIQAKGMTANSSSNTIPPLPHSPSTPSPIIPRPSYTSVSTQVTPPVVHQPSYASISIQTEPFTEIFETTIPISTNTSSPPVVQPPPTPTSSLGHIPTPSLRCQPPPSLILVSVPILESPSGSTTPTRRHASSNRLETLRPRPYPPSQIRPQPEPPPVDGSMSRVRRGRRTLKRG